MYLSLSWLKDFVDIPSSISPEELARRLTMHTVEVESVVRQADKFKNIVIGEVLEAKKHSQADKLRLTRVKVKNEILDIVCGAPNVAVGQKVPVALVGALMPSGLEIKEAVIRGEKSFGMLCAEDELGLGDDHSGIMVLDKKARVGQDLAEYLRLKDVVLEVDNKSLTNRPDLWSHAGMAREISVFLGKKFREPVKAAIDLKDDNGKSIDLKIDDFGLCPRYMAVVMDNIKVEASPDWLKDRLVSVGLRPINNIVDITNYVMLEYGQPMHAFDAAKLSPDGGYKIGVRTAKKGELIKALDGEKRELDEGMLLITNGRDPAAIAGVIGGEGSEISESTATIIFESANFNFISVRRTAAKLGLRTESSVRFEKSLDPNLCEPALYRAIELTQKICPSARIASRIADEKKFELNLGPVELDMDWLNRFIGMKMEKRKIAKILESLGFSVKKKEGDSGKIGNRQSAIVNIKIPSWRATKDIAGKEDLAEEILRIHGFDNLASDLPAIKMAAPASDQERIWEREIKNILATGASLAEVYNYSFVGEEQLRKLGEDFSPYLALANPISRDMTRLRQSLASNLIANVRTNQAKFDRFGLFEVGSVYFAYEGELPKDDKGAANLPYQEKRLGMIFAAQADDTLAELKGIVEYLLAHYNLKCDFNQTETVPAWADKNAAASVNIGGEHLGLVYRLDPAAGKASGVKKAAAIAELNLGKLFLFLGAGAARKYQALDKYPSLNRDLAFVVTEKVSYGDIRREIFAHNEYIRAVELFDIYQGEKLGRNKKSLAFHIIYQADKTLSSEEVDKIQTELIKKLENKFEAKVRDF